MSKVQYYREKLNLTQKELSEKSGISVRTIQRIESGINPKGFTAKALAKALNVYEDELNKGIEDIDITTINIINLSSLIFVFIPILNFIIPLVISTVKKEKSTITKQIITIQILWSLTFITLYFILQIFNFDELGRNIGVILILLLIFLNAFIIIRNSIELNKKKNLFFQFNFNII